MRDARAGLVALAVVVGTAASAAAPRGPKPPPVENRRLGPERLAAAYDDPQAAIKARLLARINAERAAGGAAPVALDPRASRVGDLFCADQARTGAAGHWDVAGRAPYLRWGLAGGVDYHVQNAGFLSVSSGRQQQGVEALLLDAHAKMMAEVPPDDGHRRIVLDPVCTRVGIGVGVSGGEFRMSEEFTRVGFEWMTVPAAPIAAGGVAAFGGRPLTGWDVGVVEIRFEPPPRPLSLLEIAGRGSYVYPPVVRTLWPQAGPGMVYAFGYGGDFKTARDGSFSLRFRLDQGPGSYFVVAYLRESGNFTSPMRAATAALVTALP